MTGTLLDAPALKTDASTGDETLVLDYVLAHLGTPGNMYRGDVKSLWGNHYRVNIYCADETDRLVQRVEIAHSFFATLTPEGIVCKPEIERVYE